MQAYHYRGMDDAGEEVCGFLGASSSDDAQALLKGQGIFVSNISPYEPEVTAEWSAVSLASPDSIPSGRFLAQSLPCTHEQRRMRFNGTLNVLGVDGELHLIFERPRASRPILDLHVQSISQLQRCGLVRKRLLATTATLEEHTFRGPVCEIQELIEWAKFAVEEMRKEDGQDHE